MNTIHLEASQVPATLKGGYAGKRFKAMPCLEVTIPADAGLWSGGSRDRWYAVELETGRTVAFPGQDAAPWDDRQARKVTLVPGIVVVCHVIFCGEDMGLEFHLHPENATRLLPAPVELTENEAIVLDATCGLKSSYNGMDRYEMKKRDNYGKLFMTREAWEQAKQALIERKLLDKRGAVTVAGRNARKRV